MLIALCRPFKSSTAFVTPATNEQIAAEVFLSVSVDAVKKQMRALFEKFGVEQLPQNEKRVRLVERAFARRFRFGARPLGRHAAPRCGFVHQGTRRWNQGPLARDRPWPNNCRCTERLHVPGAGLYRRGLLIEGACAHLRCRWF